MTPSPKLHPQSDHIIRHGRQHTHKSSKNFKYGFVLGPLQFQSSSQNTHLTSKAVILAVLALKKFDMPPLKPTKTETSFRKLNSLSTKLHMLFPTHLQARELCPQTDSLSLPPGPPRGRGGNRGYFPGAPKLLRGPMRLLFSLSLPLWAAASRCLFIFHIVWTQ